MVSELIFEHGIQIKQEQMIHVFGDMVVKVGVIHFQMLFWDGSNVQAFVQPAEFSEKKRSFAKSVHTYSECSCLLLLELDQVQL